MKSLVQLGIILALLAGGAARAQEQIPWTADYRQACEQAAQQRKLVLLHFYSDACEPCERLEQNVFTRPEVAAAIARSYVPVKVHAGQNPELARRYQVNRWPTDVAVTPAGLEIHRSTSPQLPEHYVELCDLMALKAGVGTGQQWAANMQQVGQATLGQAAGAAQQAASQGQQQWNLTAQQFSGMVDQSKSNVQQWGQQAQSSAQQYQQQAQGAVQQFQAKAADTAQQYQQQTQVAGQQLQGAAQQFGDSARSAITQWQPPASVGNFGAAAPAATGTTFVAAPATKNVAPAVSPPASVANPFIGQVSTGPATTANAAPQQQAAGLEAQASQQFVAASQAPPVSLEGYCSVTLLETRKWKKADPQFGAIHRGRTYLFAGADQQKKFLANPDAFAPVLSGYDAVRFATTGQLVEGSRAHGLITPGDNRIFLFEDEASLEQFKQSPRAYADPAYQAMLRTEAGPNYR
jgi:hypothetical protein